MTLIKNEGIEILKCDKCGELGIDQSHVCFVPKTQLEKDMEFLAENPTGFFRYQDDLFKKELEKVEKRFPPATVRKVLVGIYDQLIANCDLLVGMEYEKYHEATKKGVPFKEKQLLIDKERVTAILRVKDKLRIDRTRFKVRPFYQWLSLGDVDTMKRIGFNAFLAMYFKTAQYFVAPAKD